MIWMIRIPGRMLISFIYFFVLSAFMVMIWMIRIPGRMLISLTVSTWMLTLMMSIWMLTLMVSTWVLTLMVSTWTPCYLAYIFSATDCQHPSGKLASYSPYSTAQRGVTDAVVRVSSI